MEIGSYAQSRGLSESQLASGIGISKQKLSERKKSGWKIRDATLYEREEYGADVIMFREGPTKIEVFKWLNGNKL